MDTATITYNASDLDREMAWLAEVIDMRIRLKTGRKSRYRNATKIKPPSLRRSKSEYGRFVLEHGLEAPERSHPFSREQVLRLEEPPPGQPMLSGQLLISESALRLFTTGEIMPPGFDPYFPATRMQSEMQWEDLVLAAQVQTSLSRIEAFLQNRDSLTRQWQQGKHHTRDSLRFFTVRPAAAKPLLRRFSGKKPGWMRTGSTCQP